MSDYKWVVRNSDGQFCLGGGPQPSVYPSDSINYSLVDTGDLGVPYPDPRTQKWNGSAVVAKTAQEITDYDLALQDAIADVYYKDKNILAMCAVIEEVVNLSWGTLTNAQKRAAVVARAVRFNQQRKWVERNYALMNF